MKGQKTMSILSNGLMFLLGFNLTVMAESTGENTKIKEEKPAIATPMEKKVATVTAQDKDKKEETKIKDPKFSEQEQKKQEEEKQEKELGIGDPFAYSSSHFGEYSPLSEGVFIGQISIKGVIQIEGEEPIAILCLDDTKRSYYVKKNDVIRINRPKTKSSALVTEAYIIVKDIRDNEVELVQQERPDKVIIIR